MKQKRLLNIFISAVTVIAIVGIGLNNEDYKGLVDGRATQIKDCDYYFESQNGYTSLYDINEDLFNKTTLSSYKTWGTITQTFTDLSNNFNFYIQSTDKNGNVSSILIYQSARTDLSEGNVVTITGSVTLYNNLPEFINPIIELDEMINPSPVTILETDATFWQNTTTASSSEFLNAQQMGTRQVKITNALISHVNSGNASLTFDEGPIVPVYYANIKKTSAIETKIKLVNNSYVDVIGYLHSYISGSTTKLQLLIREVRHIIGGEEISYSLSLDSSSGYYAGKYADGNYDSDTVLGYTFEHYRAVNGNGNFIKLLPNNNGVGDTSAPGAIYNIDPIYDINKIVINYYTDIVSGTAPTLKYGKTPLEMTTVPLELAMLGASKTIMTEDTNYFLVETSEAILTIASINVYYTDADYGASFTYQPANEDLFRINPIVYTGEITNGASVSVPTKVTRSGNTYTIEEEKTYTYYTYPYVSANPSLANDAAYTDPVDVAAFYTAFKTWPANYVEKEKDNTKFNNAKNIFGDKTRVWQVFSRTDGYALSLPYQVDNQGKPLYYELDIALDSSYSSSKRGVGRVVCWDYGFDTTKGAVDYDSSPVCVYTDDHYATFQEYLNIGEYGTRFNSEKNRTPYIWGPATTLMGV